MKKLILLFAILAAGVANAQWKTIDSKDEFGDPTGEKREVIYTDGVFSNSATTNSVAAILIERTENVVGISLGDYGGSPNTYYKHSFDIYVKKLDGTKFNFRGAVNTYSSYSGYKSTKWILFKNQVKPEKPSNWSDKKWKKHQAKYNLNGVLGELQVGYDVLRNLETGDVIVIKEDTSKYKFTIK